MRRNHSEDRVVDRRRRRMRQHLVNHRRKCLWVGRIEATGDSGLSHALRIGGTDVLESHNRQNRDE